MMTEREVLEGAEKIIDERGYDWESYGWGNSTGSLCLGGAFGIALGVADPRANTDAIHHPACARIFNLLPQPPLESMTYQEDSILAVSRATRNSSETEVRAALSQAISECRAEEASGIEGRELAVV